MDGEIFLGALGLAIAAVLFWFVLRPKWLDRVPDGWSLGPTINGKNRSVGVLLEGQAFAFPFPNRAAGHVHAMLYKGLKLRTSLTLRYRVIASPSVTFHPQESPGTAGEVSLMIQRKGDDYSAAGEKQWFRLYAPGPQNLAPGEHTLTVDLKPAGWCGVWGGEPSNSQFAEVLANLQAVHVCFGGAGGRAHGVFASGPARFEVIELR